MLKGDRRRRERIQFVRMVGAKRTRESRAGRDERIWVELRKSPSSVGHDQAVPTAEERECEDVMNGEKMHTSLCALGMRRQMDDPS